MSGARLAVMVENDGGGCLFVVGKSTAQDHNAAGRVGAGCQRYIGKNGQQHHTKVGK